MSRILILFIIFGALFLSSCAVSEDDLLGTAVCSLDEQCGDDSWCDTAVGECKPLSALSDGAIVRNDGDAAASDSVVSDTAQDNTVVQDNAGTPDNTVVQDNTVIPDNTVVPDNDIASTDKPMVVESTPSAGAYDAALGVAVVLKFNMDMDSATFRDTNTLIYEEDSPGSDAWTELELKTIAYNQSDFTVTLTPKAQLKKATKYKVKLLQTVLSKTGQQLTMGSLPGYLAYFETIKPPYIASSTPADSAGNIKTNITKITVTFSEAIDPASTIAAVLYDILPGVDLTKEASTDNVNFTFTIPTGTVLSDAKDYNVSIAGAKDLAGNQMDDALIKFTTEYLTAPEITEKKPDAADAEITNTVKIVFSQKMSPATITEANITLKKLVGGTPVDITPSPVVSYDAATKSALVTATLTSGTSYEAEVKTGVKNISGLALASAVKWQFSIKQSEVILMNEFDADDGSWAVKDNGTDKNGWQIDTAGSMAEIKLDGSSFYYKNVDSWLYTAVPVDLSTVTVNTYLAFSLVISTYASTINDNDNDGVEILLWNTDSESMSAAHPVGISDIKGTNTTYLDTFQSDLAPGYEGIVGYDSTLTYYTYTIDVSAYKGQKLGVVFRFISNDAFTKKYGAWIDWVKVYK